MSDTPRLPTAAEQMATYQERRRQFERAFAAWVEGGRVGPPPPHPVRPHTPGFKIPDTHIGHGDYEDE